nr:NHLP leader peptide family RiPP precursor [Rudanella lutea]
MNYFDHTLEQPIKQMEISQEQKLYAQVVAKAWEDAQFKSELINNPLETIEKLTGEKILIGQGQKFLVVDQTDESTVYFNLPKKVELDCMELSDEQLEMVAGGESILLAIAICTFVGGAFVGGYAIGKDMATRDNTESATAQ